MGFVEPFNLLSQVDYGVPGKGKYRYELMFGIGDKHSSYILFGGDGYGYYNKYAIGICPYRYIYAFNQFFVLSMSCLVNGYMTYISEYNTIYYTHTYGFVLMPSIGIPIGYCPLEEENEETGKLEGDKFWQIKGIENNSFINEITPLELIPRGAWKENHGSEESPGVQTGYMCWCGFINQNGVTGRYNKIDTCKQFGTGYPLENVNDNMHVGVATWSNSNQDVTLCYGPDKTGEYCFYGNGVVVVGSKINVYIGKYVYMTDKNKNDIKLEETILLKRMDAPEEEDSWIYLNFDGYKDANLKINIATSQVSTWV